MVGTGIAIQLPHNTYGRIAPRSRLAVKHQLATNAGVIDCDYRGEVKVVLVNQGNQPYRVKQEDRIAQLIIQKINNEELQEVAELDDTIRGDQGLGSSNTKAQSGKAQSVKSQSAKPRMEINEISARAFGQFYRRAEEIGILRWDKVENEIQLEAINISTELAIKNKKNNEDSDTKDIVLREYHHLLDVFEKGENTTLPPHRPGIDLGIDLEEGKTVPIKKTTHSATTRLRNYIGTSNRTNNKDGSVESRPDEHHWHLLCLSKRRTTSSGSVWATEH